MVNPLEFDESTIRENAAAWGKRMVQEGPDTVLDQIEELLPEEWRDQVRAFPLTAVALGIGVGLWLGWRKSDEVLAAGSALISAAAMANVSQVMEKVKQS